VTPMGVRLAYEALQGTAGGWLDPAMRGLEPLPPGQHLRPQGCSGKASRPGAAGPPFLDPVLRVCCAILDAEHALWP
jgi:hypothetical protein